MTPFCGEGQSAQNRFMTSNKSVLSDFLSTYHEHPQKVDQQKQQGLLGDDDDEDDEVDR